MPIPPTYPEASDAAAGQHFRARLLDGIGETQNAAYAYGLRGGMSQSWPSGLSTSGAAGYSQACQWRVPVWPGVSDLEIAMRHTASVGTYGFRKAGDAAPAATAFGAGDDAAMTWNAQAYTSTTYDASAQADHFDFEMLLNNSASLRRVSIGHGVTTVAAGQYSDGFERWGAIAQADPGAAAFFHQGVDNLTAQSEVKTCWSAWSAPDATNILTHTFVPPMLAFPVFCPGRIRDSRTVRVWVKLARVAPALSGRIDIRLGTPTPLTTARAYGRIMDSLSTANAAGEWLGTTFDIPEGFEMLPGLPGGLVHIDTENHLIDAAIQSISVWMEPAS